MSLVQRYSATTTSSHRLANISRLTLSTLPPPPSAPFDLVSAFPSSPLCPIIVSGAPTTKLNRQVQPTPTSILSLPCELKVELFGLCADISAATLVSLASTSTEFFACYRLREAKLTKRAFDAEAGEFADAAMFIANLKESKISVDMEQQPLRTRIRQALQDTTTNQLKQARKAISRVKFLARFGGNTDSTWNLAAAYIHAIELGITNWREDEPQVDAVFLGWLSDELIPSAFRKHRLIYTTFELREIYRLNQIRRWAPEVLKSTMLDCEDWAIVKNLVEGRMDEHSEILRSGLRKFLFSCTCERFYAQDVVLHSAWVGSE